MKKRSALALGAFQLLLFCACGGEDYSSDFPSDMFGGTAGSASGTVSVAGDLDDINVAIDTTPLYEEETIPADGSDPLYDDYVENTEWKNIFTITYNGNSATAKGGTQLTTFTATSSQVR
ncbi:MAG: hypothetical protein LUC44_02295 [Prevotellaceae bacterium]|nr:hypothetical protein [Prevotellaceae bacterium]